MWWDEGLSLPPRPATFSEPPLHFPRYHLASLVHTIRTFSSFTSWGYLLRAISFGCHLSRLWNQLSWMIRVLSNMYLQSAIRVNKDLRCSKVHVATSGLIQALCSWFNMCLTLLGLTAQFRIQEEPASFRFKESPKLLQFRGSREHFWKCYGNQSNSCQGISLKTTNVNLMVMLQEKSGGHQTQKASLSGDHVYLK